MREYIGPTEKKFISQMSAVACSEADDIYLHKDYDIIHPITGKPSSCDHKQRKKLIAHQGSFQYKYFLIEETAVARSFEESGKVPYKRSPGWLYSEAEYIVWTLKDSWMFVNVIQLRKYITELMKDANPRVVLNDFTNNNYLPNLKTWYGRKKSVQSVLPFRMDKFCYVTDLNLQDNIEDLFIIKIK